MPVIAVKPYIFKRPKLNVKDNNASGGPKDLGDFEAHISKATLDPNVSIVTWTGGTPDAVFKDTTTPDWSAGFELAQDISTAGALWAVLNANVGKVLHFKLSPNSLDATGKAAEFDAIAVPAGFGGTVGAVSTSQVTLPVIGQPTFA